VALRRLRGLLAFRWSLGAAVVVSLVVVADIGSHPRRGRNPYRGVTAGAELRRDLPAGRASPGRAIVDLARAGVLLAPVVFWAWRLSRVVPGDRRESPLRSSGRRARVWREALAFQLGAWLTLAATATILAALTAFDGG
jgi:hypothetical protein